MKKNKLSKFLAKSNFDILKLFLTYTLLVLNALAVAKPVENDIKIYEYINTNDATLIEKINYVGSCFEKRYQKYSSYYGMNVDYVHMCFKLNTKISGNFKGSNRIIDNENTVCTNTFASFTRSNPNVIPEGKMNIMNDECAFKRYEQISLCLLNAKSENDRSSCGEI